MRKVAYLLLTFTIFGCSNTKGELPENFDFGTTKNGTYQNNYFDMTVTFNPEWHVQDKQQMNQLMEVGAELITQNNEDLKSVIKASKVNVAYLLTVFKHEVGAPVPSNPSFMSIAENVKMFPGVKNGEDYLYHAKKLLKQTGLNYSFGRDFYKKNIGNTAFYVMECEINQSGFSRIFFYRNQRLCAFTCDFLHYRTRETRVI